MQKLINAYDSIEEKILVVSLAFNTILLFIQVIMRFVFNNSLSWSEELARYIFIWEIWLGSSITYREDKHIKVEFLYDIFKGEKARAVIDIIANLILLVFCVVMVWQGKNLVVSMYTRNTLSPAMRLPLWTVYLSLPVGMVAVVCRIIRCIIKNVRILGNKEGGTE